MRVAQVAPLYESVPPVAYGGTERVVSWLTEELVRRAESAGCRAICLTASVAVQGNRAVGVDYLQGGQKHVARAEREVIVTSGALERAAKTEGRGYYFDFVEFQKNHENGMTPSTPVIPSWSATICANAVSRPWPCGAVPE